MGFVPTKSSQTKHIKAKHTLRENYYEMTVYKNKVATTSSMFSA